MRLLWNAVWFVVIILAAALAKLLFDNIPYAAVMARLKNSFGIGENDVIAIVATSLIPIAATVAVVAFIYWRFSQHHRIASTGASESQTPAMSPHGYRAKVIKRLFLQRDSLPIIVIALSVALTSGPSASEDQKEILQGLLTMINYLSIAKTFEDRAYELIDDRAPKIQTDGPDDFMARLNDLQTGYYSVINGFPYILRILRNTPDVQSLTKVEVIPDCLERTRSLYAEIKRINEHKGPDVVFTLENNTILAKWRAGLPECDKWISDKLDAAKKKYVEYGGH